MTYTGREQTLVKHFILRKYLERFAHIIGAHWDTITYVDCFAGPWNVRSERFEDSSFHIALEQLRKARATHWQRGREIRLRCFFIEKDVEAFQLLRAFADRTEDAEIETRNGELEDAIDPIVCFVRAGGRRAFPFIFVDPTGWTGFGMKTIAPLLRLEPGEVLINLMTGHITRFVESPQEQTQQSFEDLFGSYAFKAKVEGLARSDRLDAIVQAYAENVRRTGNFRYACSAAILHPEIDRVHFHLIYAMRSPTGVEVFKETEKQAMAVMEAARAEAQKRRREARTGQPELFGSGTMHRSGYYDALRERYLGKVKTAALQMLQTHRHVAYDDLWETALNVPLVWESDLKAWLREWKDRTRIEGMEPRQRTPRRGAGNRVVWLWD